MGLWKTVPGLRGMATELNGRTGIYLGELTPCFRCGKPLGPEGILLDRWGGGDQIWGMYLALHPRCVVPLARRLREEAESEPRPPLVVTEDTTCTEITPGDDEEDG